MGMQAKEYEGHILRASSPVYSMGILLTIFFKKEEPGFDQMRAEYLYRQLPGGPLRPFSV